MRWLCIVSGIVLLLAIPTGWPYSFYILLRWAIFISSIIVAYGFYKSNILAWAFIFGAVAFIFNPIAPLYLGKSTWVIFDFIGAALFFLAAKAKK
ncbi:MAG: hypothetical protein Q8P26_03825 [Candidatus Levybacteria bacterium]|nr:hypothetical protein [Candidatus Levybacteria bacterium]